MWINYLTKTIDTTDDLVNCGTNEFGLITCGQKTTAGAPDTDPGKYIAACIIENEGDSTLYFNSGNTATPVWTPLGSSLNVTRVLTPAEVLAIGTVPIILIPAPGLGLTIVPTLVLAKTNFVTTSYVGAGADLTMRMTYSGTPTAVAASFPSSQLSTPVTLSTYASTPAGSASTIIENTGIQIANVSGIDPTAGDSPITIYVEYRVVTL